MEKVKEFKPAKRAQVIAPNPVGTGYMKHGQYVYVVAMTTAGGMHWIDKDGDSPKGQKAYLISKTKDARSGALWISEDGIRFTGK